MLYDESPNLYITSYLCVVPPPMGGGESLKSKTDRPNIHLFRLKKDSL